MLNCFPVFLSNLFQLRCADSFTECFFQAGGQFLREYFLLNFRAQDKAAVQLSELEEEMELRIQAAEHKVKKEVSILYLQYFIITELSVILSGIDGYVWFDPDGLTQSRSSQGLDEKILYKR